jgi:hypothetical protein
MTWQEWLKLLVPVIVPLALAVLAYIDFFRRRRNEEQARRDDREYELVRKRYLDEGLDQLIGNVQKALTIYQQNWLKAMSLLKQFREFAAEMDRPDVEQFAASTLDEMDVRPTHRVRTLVRDDVIWNLVQLLSGFMFSAHFDITQDLAGCINMILDGKVQLKVPKEDMFETYRGKLTALNSRSHKYFIFLSFLHHLSTILERNRFTFESVESFADRDDVKNIVSELHQLEAEIQAEKKTEPAPGHVP